MKRGAVALPVALALIAVVLAVVAGTLAATALETSLAQRRIATAQALAAVDGCVDDVVAGLPIAWDFADVLRGPDGRAGTADDGVLQAPAGCAARGVGLADRLVLTATASAGGGRRGVQAVVGRWGDAGAGAPLWAAGDLALAQVQGTVRFGLAGTTPPRVAAVAAPVPPLALDDWLGSRSTSLGTGVDPPQYAAAPPLAGLASRARVGGLSPGVSLVAGTPAAALTYAGGDLELDRAVRGAGLLVVEGRLRISGALDFDGVVAATAGVDLDPAASLTVRGSLWVGADPTAPAAARGTLVLTYDAAAVARAATFLTLPRRPKRLSLRDLDG